MEPSSHRRHTAGGARSTPGPGRYPVGAPARAPAGPPVRLTGRRGRDARRLGRDTEEYL